MKHCENCKCEEVAAAKQAATKAAIVQAKLDVGETFRAHELVFAASSRCSCGAGMAYPKGLNAIGGFWDCSDILMGIAKVRDGKRHTSRQPFILYEIKSELQPSAEGRTTRRQDQLY